MIPKDLSLLATFLGGFHTLRILLTNVFFDTLLPAVFYKRGIFVASKAVEIVVSGAQHYCRQTAEFPYVGRAASFTIYHIILEIYLHTI